MKNSFTRTPWTSEIIRNLRLRFSDDEIWSKRIDGHLHSTDSARLHLAVFVEPYLQYVLDGKKTVESRFGIHRRPPFGHVSEGDILLLKRSGGPVTGVCLVARFGFMSWTRSPGERSKRNSQFPSVLRTQTSGINGGQRPSPR